MGLPKTIDQDLGGTDVTFVFDKAIGIAAAAGIDGLHATAKTRGRGAATGAAREGPVGRDRHVAGS